MMMSRGRFAVAGSPVSPFVYRFGGSILDERARGWERCVIQIATRENSAHGHDEDSERREAGGIVFDKWCGLYFCPGVWVCPMQSTVVLYNRVTLQIKRVAASFDTRRSFRGASLRAIRRVIKLVYILIKKKGASLGRRNRIMRVPRCIHETEILVLVRCRFYVISALLDVYAAVGNLIRIRFPFLTMRYEYKLLWNFRKA